MGKTGDGSLLDGHRQLECFAVCNSKPRICKIEMLK